MTLPSTLARVAPGLACPEEFNLYDKAGAPLYPTRCIKRIRALESLVAELCRMLSEARKCSWCDGTGEINCPTSGGKDECAVCKGFGTKPTGVEAP